MNGGPDRTFLRCLLAVFLLAAFGCAKPVEKCVGPEDNAAHHYLRGMELLERGEAAEAGEKFERARYCDELFSPAYSGLAIASSLRAASMPQGLRAPGVEKAYFDLERAGDLSRTPEDEFQLRLASIRVNTILKSRKWLSDAEEDFRKAMRLKVDETKLLYYEGREAAGYFMGAAYLEAREFELAGERFADVLKRNPSGKWAGPSDAAWKKTDRIVRAIGGATVGDVGKEVALMDSVTRRDMAALLVDELKVESLFAGRLSEEKPPEAGFVPVDIADDPFREEMMALVRWRVRGFEPFYDEGRKAYLFRPGQNVLRKEFALAIEDILVKLTGDEEAASRFFGHEASPFPDVPPTAPWYNAIMNVTTRNIMETELSGDFRPDDPLDGAEAILAIRVLRQRLNIH